MTANEYFPGKIFQSLIVRQKMFIPKTLMLGFAVLGFVCISSASVYAQVPVDSSAVSLDSMPQSLNIGWQLIKVMFSLIAIIGLIFGSAFLVKKYFGKNLLSTSNKEWFQIIARIPIQPKLSLALVKVFDQTLLLGITESAITLITELDEGQDLKRIIAETKSPTQTFGRRKFVDLFKQQMRVSKIMPQE